VRVALFRGVDVLHGYLAYGSGQCETGGPKLSR
jgi:hypothetical protein